MSDLRQSESGEAGTLVTTWPASLAAEFARLEFGKFCISAEGPIEGRAEYGPAGYGQLGHSASFPPALLPFCTPTVLGAGWDKEPNTDQQHSTFWRPVFLSAQDPYQVCCRIRTRSERGEGQRGRRYLLARYLVSAQPITPLAWWHAMESAPLKGTSRNAAQRLPALIGEQWPIVTETEPDYAQSFLPSALVYLLSGIPLIVTGNWSEKDFFLCATLLWQSLPHHLRAYFSAGWRVGPALNGKLAMSYGDSYQPEPHCAAFLRGPGEWTNPSHVFILGHNGQLVEQPFSAHRLELGKFYLRWHFGTDTPDWQQCVAPTQTATEPPPPLPALSALADWQSPLIVRTFRWPAICARDFYLLQELENWLRTGQQRDNSQLLQNVSLLAQQKNRDRAWQTILTALGQPASQARALEIFQSSLTGVEPKHLKPIIDQAPDANASLARLLLALHHQQTEEVLHELARAPATSKWEELPDEVVNRIYACLTDSLRFAHSEIARLHAALLSAKDSALYCQWARQHLAVLASSPLPLSATDYAQLMALAETPAHQTLCQMLAGKPVTDEAQGVIAALNETERNHYCQVLWREWSQPTANAARRETLWGWFQLLRPSNNLSPLLRLISGEALTENDVACLVEEIEQQRVPPQLMACVAGWALANWSRLAVYLNQHLAWESLIRLWPEEYAQALVFSPPRPAVARDALSPLVVQAARNLQPSMAELKRLWEQQKQFRLAHLEGKVAALFWHWATHSGPSAESLNSESVAPHPLELCGPLTNARWPQSAGLLSPAICQEFVKLVTGANRRQVLETQCETLWQSATQGRQLLLLLELFPYCVLVPTARQLSWLVSERPWLVDYLARYPRHKRFFDLATLDFHSRVYSPATWRDDYAEDSVIWAVFRGVPPDKQPAEALIKALRVYCPEEPQAIPEASLQGRAELCLKYLRGYQRVNGLVAALMKVLLEFVLPNIPAAWRQQSFYNRARALYRDGRIYSSTVSSAFDSLVDEIILQDSNLTLVGKALAEYTRLEKAAQKRNATRNYNNWPGR